MTTTRQMLTTVGLITVMVLIGLCAGMQAGASSPIAIPAQLDDADLATYLAWATMQNAGASSRFGGFRFWPITHEAYQESAAIAETLLERLESYDLSAYPQSDQLDARIWMLEFETRIGAGLLCDHEYLISSYATNYPALVESFCANTFMIRDEQGVIDDLERISVVETRYDEVIERLKRSEAIGAIPARSDLLAAVIPLRETAESAPAEHTIYRAVEARINTLEDLSDEAREDYLGQYEAWLETSLFPATERLADYVEALAERAPEDGGVWRHQGGEDYYQHKLLKYATTTMSPKEIHELGLREVDRVRGEIFEAAAALGFTETESLPVLFDAVAEAAGTVTGDATVAYCQELIDGLNELAAEAFGTIPEADVMVAAGEGTNYYSPGTATFTVAAGIEKSLHEVGTSTYHEVLGHHIQKSMTESLDLPTYRKWMLFNAYSEGWAMYAERLAWELGAYEDDPYGNLGRLQYELLRAVRLVVDTGLHAERWTSQQAFDYMWENTGLDEQMIRDQITRYLVLPGQATSYLLGMHTILTARARAMDRLGEAFDLAEFHNCILVAGEVPLPFIDEIVDQYVDETLAGGAISTVQEVDGTTSATLEDDGASDEAAAAAAAAGNSNVATLDGQGTLYFEMVGPENPEEVIIAVHSGPGLSSDYMSSLCELVTDTRAVVFYDQRGVGQSSKRFINYELGYYVEDLDAIRQAVGADSVHLLGHNWGSLVALNYAATYPHRVRSLIFMAGGVFNVEGIQEAYAAVGERIANLQEEGIIPDPTTKYADTLPAFFSDPNFDMSDDLRNIVGNDDVRVETWMAIGDSDPAVGFDRITHSILAVYGEDDPYYPQFAKYTPQLLTSAHLTIDVIAQCGHFWHEQPEAFFASVEAFLAALPNQD